MAIDKKQLQLVAEKSRITDISLAAEGHKAIAWASRNSPVLNGLLRKTLEDGSFKNKKVALVIHLEAKTAFLATDRKSVV